MPAEEKANGDRYVQWEAYPSGGVNVNTEFSLTATITLLIEADDVDPPRFRAFLILCTEGTAEPPKNFTRGILQQVVEGRPRPEPVEVEGTLERLNGNYVFRLVWNQCSITQTGKYYTLAYITGGHLPAKPMDMEKTSGPFYCIDPAVGQP